MQEYHDLQGSYPVISLSFANMKEKNYEMTRYKINMLLEQIYQQYTFLKSSGLLSASEIRYFDRISKEMDDADAAFALLRLSEFLYRYYDKKVILLLDEYDAPMQEAYVNGYWNDLAGFMMSLLNATFKTNPYLERGILTGITRVSKESIFQI